MTLCMDIPLAMAKSVLGTPLCDIFMHTVHDILVQSESTLVGRDNVLVLTTSLVESNFFFEKIITERPQFVDAQ